MEYLVTLLSPYLPAVIVGVLLTLVVLISLASFFFDVRGLYDRFKEWRKTKVDFETSLKRLRQTDYFIAHIIHLGGRFSMTYSMFVYSDEDGGVYFNPPKEFVGVGFNRGGDLMIVSPSQLAARAGFKVDSVLEPSGRFSIQKDRSFCHLSIEDLKNEYGVKFVRSK